MYLRTFLAEYNLTVKDLSKEIGCSYIHLIEVKNGKRKPSLMLAKAIEHLTQGAVTVDEMMHPLGKE